MRAILSAIHFALTGRTIMTLRAIGPMLGALGICATIGVGALYITKSTAQSADVIRPQAERNASPIYGVTIPDGYRDWRLISVKQLTGAAGKLKQLRAQLGNDIATKAFRDGTLPFPDGTIIAALHWNEVSSDADNKVLAVGFPDAGLESFFAGSAVNVQFMVKDSKKYTASGGWGFADFANGQPGNEALHEKCFPCHQPAKDRDYVFTHYAPTP
jgi:Cytochrome P460